MSDQIEKIHGVLDKTMHVDHVNDLIDGVVKPVERYENPLPLVP